MSNKYYNRLEEFGTKLYIKSARYSSKFRTFVRERRLSATLDLRNRSSNVSAFVSATKKKALANFFVSA